VLGHAAGGQIVAPLVAVQNVRQLRNRGGPSPRPASPIGRPAVSNYNGLRIGRGLFQSLAVSPLSLG
jgi:hypothetical protein